MAKLEKAFSDLQKLYAKRTAMDKHILDAEKKLVAEAKAEPAAVPAKKPAAKKPVAKKAKPKA